VTADPVVSLYRAGIAILSIGLLAGFLLRATGGPLNCKAYADAVDQPGTDVIQPAMTIAMIGGTAAFVVFLAALASKRGPIAATALGLNVGYGILVMSSGGACAFAI
jgi:hypothetical protein